MLYHVASLRVSDFRTTLSGALIASFSFGRNWLLIHVCGTYYVGFRADNGTAVCCQLKLECAYHMQQEAVYQRPGMH